MINSDSELKTHCNLHDNLYCCKQQNGEHDSDELVVNITNHQLIFVELTINEIKQMRNRLKKKTRKNKFIPK